MTDADKPSLSLKSLRILHRYVDDLALLLRTKRGELAVVDLERLLGSAGAETDEIRHVLADYRRLRKP